MDDDVDFNKELDDVTSTKENHDERKWFFLEDLRDIQLWNMSWKNYTKRTKKNILITIDKFMNIYGEKIKNMQICVMSIPVSKKMPKKCFHLLILTPTSCRIAGSFKTSGWKVSWKCRKLFLLVYCKKIVSYDYFMNN